MQCTSPIKIAVKTGSKAFSDLYREVPCGQCLACRLNYARMWSIRIIHESQLYYRNVFATLTYNDDNLPEDKSLSKRALQLFLKRLRKSLSPRKIRYFAVGEYGGKFGRPHYHAILFNVSKRDLEVVRSCWPFGFVRLDTVTVDSANYVAKYSVKKLRGEKGREYYLSHGIIPEFSIMSSRPGIGYDYMRLHESSFRNRKYVVSKGVKYSLPRYYDQKIFGDDVDRKVEKLTYSAEKVLDLKRQCQENHVDFFDFLNEFRQQVNLNLISRMKGKDKK